MHEIWYDGNAIQGDVNTIIFNPISSTVLKWLRLKFFVGGMILCLAQQWFGIV
jgi:hypothetical protein